MPSALSTHLALAALACAITAAPAHAQGGLLRKMKEKAAAAAGQAAAGAAGVEAPSQSGQGSQRGQRGQRGQRSSFTPSTPKFDDRVVEMTDARIDGMLKALATERTETERYMQQSAANQKRQEAEKKAYDARYAEYQKTREAYERKSAEVQMCRAGALGGSKETQATQAKMAANMSTMTEADAQRMQKRMEDLSKRGQAARDRGDQKTVMAITDTIQTLMQQMTGVSSAEMQRMGKEGMQNKAAADKCGEAGTAPVEPEAPNSGGNDAAAQSAIAAAAAKAAGLNPEQYAVMRERLAYIVSVNGEFSYSTSYAYSSGEIAAVKKRLGELGPYKEQLQMGGTPTWDMGR